MDEFILTSENLARPVFAQCSTQELLGVDWGPLNQTLINRK